MGKAWFEKAILTTPVMVAGKAVGWEALAGNHGVLELDTEKDGELIEKLNDFAAKKKGGVGIISEEQYLQKKKLHPWKPSAPKSWLDEPLKIVGKKLSKSPPRPASAAVVKEARPALPGAPAKTEVPQRPPDQPDFREAFKPATKKLKAIPAASDV